MTYLRPATREEVARFEWESLVGSLIDESKRIKEAVELRHVRTTTIYDELTVRIHDQRLMLDELQRRLQNERQHKETINAR